MDPIGDDPQESGCSLRDAVSVANAAIAEGLGCTYAQAGSGQPASYVITLPAMRYQLLGDSDAGETGGDIDIQATVTILGAGQTLTVIEGNGQDRVLHVTSSNASLTLRDLEITGGIASFSRNGGGILVERGDLDLERVLVRGNSSEGSFGDGGGISNQEGRLRIGQGSLLTENTATRAGGGVYSIGEMALEGAELRANSALFGGGMNAQGPGITLSDCLVIENSADSSGGGLALQGDGAGVAAVENCSIVHNSAYRGGGVTASLLDLANSTISGNIASERAGASLTGSRLTNVTIVGNRATSRVGGFFMTGVLANSIIAGNETDLFFPDCGPSFGRSGSVEVRGVNVIGNNLGCTEAFDGGLPNSDGDYVGFSEMPLDPRLKRLGGVPAVILPQADSLVIDQISRESCVYAAGPGNGLFSDGERVERDQRGVAREGLCDIGAVESDLVFDAGFEVTDP